ncbi:MAG: phytanoyl-CoA dioxygenase family protein [Pseudomonadota bacterium]
MRNNPDSTLFHQQGFLIHDRPVLPSAIVDRARQGVREIQAGRYNRKRSPEASPWKPGDREDILCKIEQPQFANNEILELVSRSEIGELAAMATGAAWVQVWWVQLLVKPGSGPGNPTEDKPVNIGWHQDRSYWGAWSDNSELLTAWVALTDVDALCGPMRFVTGSHRFGYLRGQSGFHEQDLGAIRSRFELPAGERWQEVPVHVPAGGLSLHHKLVIHGSEKNASGDDRISLAIHMRTDRSAPRYGQRDGLTRFIDDHEICPVIYGRQH